MKTPSADRVPHLQRAWKSWYARRSSPGLPRRPSFACREFLANAAQVSRSGGGGAAHAAAAVAGRRGVSLTRPRTATGMVGGSADGPTRGGSLPKTSSHACCRMLRSSCLTLPVASDLPTTLFLLGLLLEAAGPLGHLAEAACKLGGVGGLGVPVLSEDLGESAPEVCQRRRLPRRP